MRWKERARERYRERKRERESKRKKDRESMKDSNSERARERKRGRSREREREREISNRMGWILEWGHWTLQHMAMLQSQENHSDEGPTKRGRSTLHHPAVAVASARGPITSADSWHSTVDGKLQGTK